MSRYRISRQRIEAEGWGQKDEEKIFLPPSFCLRFVGPRPLRRGVGSPYVRTLITIFALLLLLAEVVASAAESTSFRFAFLSDTHVGSSTGAADLRATVQDINSMTGLSFVVISGDITEYGSLEQLRLAKEILAGLKLPCHLIPGNHDTKWSESGATNFPRLWGEDRFVFEAGGFRFIGMHEGPVMKMGDGFWAPQDVRWLAETLKAMPDTNQPVIFVTHYPIDDGIANWYEALDLLKKYNTQVVLCGHGHANHRLVFEGLPGVMGRSNLRARAEVGGFNLVEVKDGQMTFSERITGERTREPWNTVALERHDFAADTNQYARPDFSVNSRYPQVETQWTFNTGYTIASTPAVSKRLAVIGDASGTVYGLALKTGGVRWKFKAQGPVYSTPAIANGLAVFGSTDGNVYAVNTETGLEAWRAETGRPNVASPAIARGKVFIGSSDGKFRALNLTDGRLAWEYAGVKGFVETQPLLYRGKVIFGAWDQNLYAIDARSGEFEWSWTGDRPGILYSPAACWPVGAHGKVFIVAPDRQMTALSAATGKQLWRTGEYQVRESIGLGEDRIYVRAMNDWFYAFSTKASQPQKLWEQNAHFGYDINSAMLVEKSGVVFYSTKSGLLFALNAKTGAVLWEHRAGVGVMNTVVPLSAREVLVTDFGGDVALVRETRANTK